MIVDAVHDGDLEVCLHAGARDVLERQLLHVEEIAGASMTVALVRRAIQLKVDLMNAGRTGACCEAVLLRESDSVRDDADAVETDAFRVPRHRENSIAMVGSPPANRMLMSRCGFTVRARSKICRTSSIESSWTYVVWLASMKQGEHFRLQRFVRSTISATPRPVRTVDGPWSWTFVCPAHAKSWPKYSDSIRLKNAGFVESTSSNVPCLAHVFRIRIWPDSSTMLRVDHAWIRPEIRDVREPVEYRADRVGVAAGT